MYITQMTSRWTRSQIWFNPRDPMVELNSRGRVSRIYRCFHSRYRKKSMGGNVHFCWGKSAVLQYSSFETFYARNSYELQLFDKSVAIKGRADDRSVCFLYVLVSYYVLIDRVKGPDGKIFGPRSWRTDRAQRSVRSPWPRAKWRTPWPRAKYLPVRPDLTQSISILSYDDRAFPFFSFFFREIKFAIGMFTYVAHFGRKLGFK